MMLLATLLNVQRGSYFEVLVYVLHIEQNVDTKVCIRFVWNKNSINILLPTLTNIFNTQLNIHRIKAKSLKTLYTTAI